MKKTLISAAVLMSLAGAAQAQVTIYGLIDASYGKSLLSDILGYDPDFHSGGDNGSSEGNSTTRIGLKGAMDVGGGTKIKFNLETGGIESDGTVNGGDAFFNRQMWAGFQGGWGEVRLGKQDSVSFQTMIGYDFNGGSNGVSAGGYSGVAPWLPGRVDRSLQYISPDMGGFKLHAGYRPKDGTDPDNPNNDDTFSIAGTFAAGPFSISGTYESSRAFTEDEFYAIAGSWDLGVVKLSASYADGQDITGVNGGSGDGYTLGIVAPVAGFNIGAIYAENMDDAADIKAYEIFINKEIFKGTYAYAEYGNWDGTIDGGEGPIDNSYDGFAIGVIFTF